LTISSRFVARGFERRDRKPLRLEDRPGRDRRPEEVVDQSPVARLAQAVSVDGRDLQVRAELDGGNARGRRSARRGFALQTGWAREPIPVDDQLDSVELGRVTNQWPATSSPRRAAAIPTGDSRLSGGLVRAVSPPASRGRHPDRLSACSRKSAAAWWGANARDALRRPCRPLRIRESSGAGSLRFRPIGTDERGLDELVELNWRRA
jgi:hypothetical protein